MNNHGDIFWAIAAAIIVIWLWDIAKSLYRYRRSRTARAAAPDWGMRMQEAAELYMAAVADAYLREEEGQQDVHSPAVAPYDGCDTCTIREVLAGAWPVIVEMADYYQRNGIELHPERLTP